MRLFHIDYSPMVSSGGVVVENYTFSAIKSHFLQRQCFYKDFLLLLLCTKFFNVYGFIQWLNCL